MSSDQHNLVTAKATGLIFFTVRQCFGLRDVSWHTAVHTMHSSCTSVHLSLLTSKVVDCIIHNMVACDGFLSNKKNYLQ